MQGDLPPKQEVEAPYKDFPVVGTQTSLALPSLPDLLQRGATLEPLFDILKKIDAVDFEWIEVVRDLQTAEARIQELQARSPGEYIIFSQRTQQIVARFNSQTASAVADGSENPRRTPDVS